LKETSPASIAAHCSVKWSATERNNCGRLGGAVSAATS
jgi:hypothetical protein